MLTMPKNYEQAILSRKIPSMRYMSGDFDSWKAEAKAKLSSLLGLDKMRGCTPTIDEDEMLRTEYDGFVEYRFTVETERGFYSPCRLRIPSHPAGEKLPLFICLQGHTTGEHISVGLAINPPDAEDLVGGVRAIANQVLAHGFCAMTIEQRGFGALGGTSKGPACHIPAMSALLSGRTIIGERVWDISRDLDAVLARFDEIDPDRIGCLGGSGGGTATYYAACMDERIRYAVPVCAVCTFKDSIAAMKHCVCNFIPGIAEYFDMGDLGALIAPRKLIVVHGMDDPIFPRNGVYESFEEIRRLYLIAGAPKNCVLVSGLGGHSQFPAPTWRAILRAMEEE